jgi:hypothetical protein
MLGLLTCGLMAKRRRAATAQIVRVPSFSRPPAQVIQIRSPRSSGAPKKKHHRRRSSGASGGRSYLGAAIGGAIFGFIEKSFPTLPTLPILGRAGTVAVAGYFLGKRGGLGHSGIIRDVTMAAAVIAGYELGKDGKISGDDDVSGSLAAQVRGISSQV